MSAVYRVLELFCAGARRANPQLKVGYTHLPDMAGAVMWVVDAETVFRHSFCYTHMYTDSEYTCRYAWDQIMDQMYFPDHWMAL